MAASGRFGPVARLARDLEDKKLTVMISNAKMAFQTVAQSIAEADASVEDEELKAQLIEEMRAFTDSSLPDSYRGVLKLRALKEATASICGEAFASDDYSAAISERMPAPSAAALAKEISKDKKDMETLVRDLTGAGDEPAVFTAPEATQDRLKCKITREMMTDPVRNGVCGHVYDRKGITSLQRPGKPWTCPSEWPSSP